MKSYHTFKSQSLSTEALLFPSEHLPAQRICINPAPVLAALVKPMSANFFDLCKNCMLLTFIYV